MFILFDGEFINCNYIVRIFTYEDEDEDYENDFFIRLVMVGDEGDKSEDFSSREARDFRWLALMGELNKR